jgi:CDGSH-type Zn-finger protein
VTAANGAEPTIVACTDGPLLVRGAVTIVDSDGTPIPQRRRTIALCRCGVSTIKPFCDGTHKLVGFRTDPKPEE